VKDEFIQSHYKTTDIALFKSEQGYWIGIYSDRVAQSLGSLAPPYVWYKGFKTESEGLAYLASMKGDEY